MRDRINDILRQLISAGIRWLGSVLHVLLLTRILAFSRRQEALRRRFNIRDETPILSFGSEIEALVQSVAHKVGDKALWARTSGSTGNPKRLLYTPRRLNSLKWVYIDSYARMCRSFKLKRTSLYVFTSFADDDSLTSLLLADQRLPNYFTTLQAPYRVQGEPAIKALVERYGSDAVRLWLLIISNPGVLYATNPATILAFLDEVVNNWIHVRQLTKDWYEGQVSFPGRLKLIVSRLGSTGSEKRISKVAKSDSPLRLMEFAPGVTNYMCWTGGYVRPFLKRLAGYLPPDRYRLVPMYSMSTETVETISRFKGRRTSFLPLAPNVLYEFVEEDLPDEPANLLRPDQLVPGHRYTMVVSDHYGLRRYQTDDLFHCDGRSFGMASISFLRRRSLEYSFTGEKLTAEQLSLVYKEVKADGFLTCIPCASSTPHYQIYAIGGNTEQDLAQELDERLSALNSEYKSKRQSGRIGAITFENISIDEFLQRLPAAHPSWETQFKFLPLYREAVACRCG